MPVAAWVLGAGTRPGRGVDTKLHAFRMNIINQCFHVRELLVRDKVSLRISHAFPGVVDVYVDVASVAHAVHYHRIDNLADGLVVDLALELVPVIPAHRRSLRES